MAETVSVSMPESAVNAVVAATSNSTSVAAGSGEAATMPTRSQEPAVSTGTLVAAAAAVASLGVGAWWLSQPYRRGHASAAEENPLKLNMNAKKWLGIGAVTVGTIAVVRGLASATKKKEAPGAQTWTVTPADGEVQTFGPGDVTPRAYAGKTTTIGRNDTVVLCLPDARAQGAQMLQPSVVQMTPSPAPSIAFGPGSGPFEQNGQICWLLGAVYPGEAVVSFAFQGAQALMVISYKFKVV